jgi:hypothetical protein
LAFILRKGGQVVSEAGDQRDIKVVLKICEIANDPVEPQMDNLQDELIADIKPKQSQKCFAMGVLRMQKNDY